ncbi:MAG TPA: hypothetical protein VMS93_13835, partial [Candidatus Saccharimonadales bacterium]|nr:hypothetical protein [Candidatus Saccharimonadales bacterium]
LEPDSLLAPYETTDAYEVYAAVLPSAWPWRGAHAESLVIRLETCPNEMCLVADREDVAVLGPAITDYERLNENAWKLQRRLLIEKAYELVPDECLTHAGLPPVNCRGPDGRFGGPGKRDYWGAFYERYPHSGGWIELSAVGFNPDKTVAVVYMASHFGWPGGQGSFHVLQKRDGKWQYMDWKGSSCSWGLPAGAPQR